MSSKQPRATLDRDVAAFFWTFFDAAEAEGFPPWGRPGRDAALRSFAQEEPILIGAVSSVTSKVTSLTWQIIGGRNRVARVHDLLTEAEGGAGWSAFLDRWVQDFLVTDLGGVVELARDGRTGPISELWNLDAVRLQLTGNIDVPLRYTSTIDNRTVPLFPEDFSRIVDLPSPDEKKLGLGFCAVSRALKAAKVLQALYRYEDEQLSDLPPQGLAAVTGMTQGEVRRAHELYDEMRKSKRQTAFKGVLWLAAQSNPLQEIKVSLTPFSSLPPHFNKKDAIELYVATLALDFGVDVREFWPFSQGQLGSGREAEIQAQKARGKGFGRLLSSIERAVNFDILSPGLEFAFDNVDSEEDLLREQVRSAVVQNVRALWAPPPGVLGAEGLLSTTEARRLLVELGALPNWIAVTDEVTATDVENEPEEEEEIGFEGVMEKALLGRREPLVRISRSGKIDVLARKQSYSLPVGEIGIPWSINEFSYGGNGSTWVVGSPAVP